MHGNKKHPIRRVAGAALLLSLLLLLAGALYLRWETPPAPAAAEPETGTEQEKTEARPREETRLPAAAAGRRSGVYTLLLAGRDDESGNTDSILFCRLDSRAHRLDLVSIPRDTLVNLDWPVRKINAVYAGTANSGGAAAEGLRREIRRLCGFAPDCCAVADLGVFVEAVDLIGGVDFELTEDMHYDDAAQDLHIHLPAGKRHLNGQEAMELVRYREGYLNGDLDRVAVQQRFMEAALERLLQLGSVPRLPELAALLASRTDTDLSAANIAWLARQLLQCEKENVRFHIMPNTPAYVAGISYTLVQPEPWLEMINDCLDPFYEEIRAENLDLVYREDGVFRATSGNLRDPSYYGQ